MSFGDDTLDPLSADEIELQRLREENKQLRLNAAKFAEIGGAALNELAAIRREVGASDSCTFTPHEITHVCTGPEPTLEAVQRAMKERVSDDACDHVTCQILMLTKSQTLSPAQQYARIADTIKRARGKGA